MLTAEKVSSLVREEVVRINDERLIATIKEHLVIPYPVERAWEYGSSNETFPCWTVLEHTPSNTAIAYCEQGFGPSYPWGLVFISGKYMGIGMDSSWFCTLESAMRGSRAWDGSNPEGYEVP